MTKNNFKITQIIITLMAITLLISGINNIYDGEIIRGLFNIIINTITITLSFYNIIIKNKN